MKKSDLVLKSLLNAFGVFIYVFTIGLFFSNAQAMFGDQENKLLIPVFMLLLFVISASVTGSLVLGKPILLYLDGLKKEAFKMLFATLGWLVLFLAVVATILALK